MIIKRIDNVEFKLKSDQDFLWIKKYGTVFNVIDETGSGCICFGVMNNNKKYFLKIAGANTVEAEVHPEESISVLKEAVKIYKILEHPNLIKLVEHYDYLNYYVAVFEWIDGMCLFDHWNFKKYSETPQLISPAKRFKELSIKKKLHVVDVMFSFLETVANNNYVAVDFYDGSIMYDFDIDRTTICDIDFFRKKPTINNLGTDFFGTKRLKAPEEYIYGTCIDEVTNVFTLGAMIFDFFGKFDNREIEERYINNKFSPCDLSKWTLSEACYKIVLKAVSIDRDKRFKTISEFYLEFNSALV
ncbi:MAG: hypothetical protein RR620_02210 [Clostridium sp.]